MSLNGAHLHLILNHIPIFAVTFGTVAFYWSWIRKSSEMMKAAILLFVLAGASSWAGTETGEMAEDIVKKLADVVKSDIEEHEMAAQYATFFAWALAVLGIAHALVEKHKPKFLRLVRIVLVICTLFGVTTQARTAYLGGKVRHTEIRNE